MNLGTELLGLDWGSFYTSNSDWGTRRGSSGVLQLGWFKLCLDTFFKEILNLKGEF